LTVAWLVLVPVLAMRVPGPPLETLQTVLRVHPERWESLVFALLCVGLAVALVVIAGWLRPAWWRRTVVGLMLVPVPILLITSGNLVAGLTVAAIGAPCLWGGRQITSRLLAIHDACDAWVIGSGLGLLALSVVGTVLLATGTFRAPVIWSFIIFLTVALVWSSRMQLRDDITTFANWLKQPSWQRIESLVAVGLILGACWLALIGALAPEFMSDAVRQRLPAAALFAREGRFAVDPDLYLSPNPRLGEVFYAIMLACGPLEAAKILNLVVGVICALAVWNLGRHLGGGGVALLALLAFATLPLSVFLAQIAYVDLFVTLFGLTAATIIVAVDQLNAGTVVAVMACLIAGLTVKDSFVYVAVGLGVTLFLLVLNRVSPKVSDFAVIVTVVGLIAGTFWVTATYVALQTVPGLTPLIAALANFHALYESHVPDMGLRTHHSLSELLRIPLDLVASTSRYGEYSAGFVGYLLVPMAPFIFFQRPSRRCQILLIGVAAALIAWFAFTPYVRYALPMLALLAAFGAAAYISIAQQSGPTTRLVMSILPPALAALGVVGYLNTVLLSPGVVPFRVVLGQESKTAYLTDHVGGYTALQLLDSEPNATGVATSNELGRIYTSARLSDVLYIVALRDGINDEASVLQFLDGSGYSHILIDRDAFRPGWDQIVAFDETFLRRNAVLVGGDQNAYLYRLVPANERGHDQIWAQGKELLPNGGFEEADGNSPRGWEATGKIRRVASGRGYETTTAAVRLEPGTILSTTVRVMAGDRYLLSQASKAVGAEGEIRMEISWLGEGKVPLKRYAETLPTSLTGYHRFSTLATAPPDARWATVKLQPDVSAAWVDDVSLRSVEADPQ
jgi:hypothetical protein